MNVQLRPVHSLPLLNSLWAVNSPKHPQVNTPAGRLGQMPLTAGVGPGWGHELLGHAAKKLRIHYYMVLLKKPMVANNNNNE